VKKLLVAVGALLIFASVSGFAQNSASDEGGRVLGLETAWNHAIEAKDTKALDMLLANTFIAVEIDGSVSSKSEFLASIKAPEYQPSQETSKLTCRSTATPPWSSEYSASKVRRKVSRTFIASDSPIRGSSMIRPGNVSPANPH